MSECNNRLCFKDRPRNKVYFARERTIAITPSRFWQRWIQTWLLLDKYPWREAKTNLLTVRAFHLGRSKSMHYIGSDFYSVYNAIILEYSIFQSWHHNWGSRCTHRLQSFTSLNRNRLVARPNDSYSGSVRKENDPVFWVFSFSASTPCVWNRTQFDNLFVLFWPVSLRAYRNNISTITLVLTTGWSDSRSGT